MKSSADLQSVGTNNPVTVTVEIAGDGNVRSVTSPRIPAIAGVRKYDTISSINISKANYRVSGSKTFKTVMIPEMPGKLTIPGFEFAFFNPAKREYQKLKSAPIEIKVTASGTPSSGVKQPVSSEGVNVVGQDVRFISMNFSKYSGPGIAGVFADVLIIIACLLFAVSFLYNRYNAFVSKNSGFIKSRRAFGEFAKGIKRLERKNPSAEKFYASVFELVTNYLGDKAGMPFTGLTFKEIENILTCRNMPQEYIKRIRELLEEADFMRFAPSMNKGVDTKKETEKIKILISEIEKGWKI
jgi:hypothetical protein